MLDDLMLVAGWLGVAYGAWVWFEPAGFITGGVLLLAGALARGRARAVKAAAAPRSEP